MSKAIAVWKPGGNGVVAAGATKKSPPFRLSAGNVVTIELKGSQDCDLWLEHGRLSDAPAENANPPVDPDNYQLPWGTELIPKGLDHAYNTQGGGNSYVITMPGGCEIVQVCLHNNGGSDATGVRVDVGVNA